MSPTQHLGVARLPKQTCNVQQCELGQFLKLSGNSVERFAIQVPRTRLEFFQDDIYSDTRTADSVLSAEDWFGGRTEKPHFMSLAPAHMTKLSDAPKIVRKVRKFETIEVEEDAADLKNKVVDKFHERMQEYKEKGQPLPQDLQEGVDEEEWSD